VAPAAILIGTFLPEWKKTKQFPQVVTTVTKESRIARKEDSPDHPNQGSQRKWGKLDEHAADHAPIRSVKTGGKAPGG
jgi:hypothetical protein